jgi:ubiquinone/menaquinone biosynthesis C-methylase UbiE
VRRPVFIARQSGNPSGLLGRIIAWIMERETAQDNAFARGLLALEPSDSVLELGFGHGRNILELARAVPQGRVAGIDHSQEMRRLAADRCAKLIESGHVALECADTRTLPYPDRHFDKALAVHTLYFWKDPVEDLKEVRRALRPGGRFVLGFRPKDDPASKQFPESVYRFHTRGDVEKLLDASGFSDIRIHHSRSPSFMVACAERPSLS